MMRKRVFFICVIFFFGGGLGWLFVREHKVSAEESEISPDTVSSGLQMLFGNTRAPQMAHDDLLSSSGSPLEASFREIANPSMTPAEVVQLQVDSIRESLEKPERIGDCFALAAPSNRAETGPMQRFARMVHVEPYSHLATSSQVAIGAPVLEGDFAAVLVTAMSNEALPHAYRFVLEKQSSEPFAECWMTVSVQYVEVVSSPSSIAQESSR